MRIVSESKLSWAGRVQTARELIDGIATRFQQSGLPYLVRFPGEAPKPLREWLIQRAKVYEASPPR